MKRTRRLTSTLEVSFRIPRPGLSQEQLNALKKAFKNRLVATLSAHERLRVDPLVKQKKSITQQKEVKVKPVVKVKPPLKVKPVPARRGTRGSGRTTKRTKRG